MGLEISIAMETTAGATIRYTKEDIKSLRITGGLFSSDSPGVGGCEARQFELVIKPRGTIKRMSPVQIWAQDPNDDYNALVKVGTFYVDSRKWNIDENTMTLRGYDSILKMDRFLWRALPADYEESFTWTAVNVMQYIANYIGVTLDTTGIWSGSIYNSYADNPPAGSDENAWYGLKLKNLAYQKMRTVAQHIAAASGGNWTIDRMNNLKLVFLSDYLTTKERYTINQDMTSDNMGANLSFAPLWTGVRLTFSGMESVESGTDSGRMIIAECPFATQSIADNVLNISRQMIYIPYELEGALVPLIAQLGDILYVGDPDYDLSTYPRMICQIETEFDGLCASYVAAPDDSDVSHEFPPEDADPLTDEEKDAIRNIIDDELGKDGLTVTLTISYTYEGAEVYAETYSYADGYQYNLGTVYPDVYTATNRTIYRPQVSTVTGTIAGDTTHEVPCDMALDMDYTTNYLSVYDVDSVDYDSSDSTLVDIG